MLEQRMSNYLKEKEILTQTLIYQVGKENWTEVASFATQLAAVEGQIKELSRLSPALAAMNQDREALRSELERLQRTHSTGPERGPRGTSEPSGGAPSEDPGPSVHHVRCGAV